MEWTLWIVVYLAIGSVLTWVLIKGLKINWEAEEMDTKLLVIATPVAWPLVLILVGFVKVFMK